MLKTEVELEMDFLRYCLYTKQRIPSITDWDALFLFMKQQALLGVGFCSVERMKAEGTEVPKAMLLKWYAVSERVRARNVILKGGNFGQHSGLTRHGMGTKYFLKIKRNMRFVRAYPAEALCEPVFRTWHFFWRMWHKY